MSDAGRCSQADMEAASNVKKRDGGMGGADVMTQTTDVMMTTIDLDQTTRHRNRYRENVTMAAGGRT